MSDEPIRGLLLGTIIIVSANSEWIGGLEHRERHLKRPITSPISGVKFLTRTTD